MILIDTDHLSVLTEPRHALRAALMNKLASAAEPVGIPIVVVEEQLRGWLAQIRRAPTGSRLTPCRILSRNPYRRESGDSAERLERDI
jgi:predicted nucleic acid-binding protein